ncbi:MAG: F0F1 ATP synthase subunit gamma [Candidatus Riflebacteria bacterium]|nr:F0F1 ATP synthase subunit gamma [Candidatus Riflebacteria bacterium]
MSQTPAVLGRQIKSAQGLKSVIRTMKTLAAVSIGPYEKALQSLNSYVRTVEMGITSFFRNADPLIYELATKKPSGALAVIVFGTDQGMVGGFNDQLARFVTENLREYKGDTLVWPVGERVHLKLPDGPFHLMAPIHVPESVETIPGLMSQLLTEIESEREKNRVTGIQLFYNQPSSSHGFEHIRESVFPLDKNWLSGLKALPWPTRIFPELFGGANVMFSALVREFLFVSLFKACASSGVSEHATRLAAMQRAEKNTDERLEELGRAFNQLRQSFIDEELFDVISGFEALKKP